MQQRIKIVILFAIVWCFYGCNNDSRYVDVVVDGSSPLLVEKNMHEIAGVPLSSIVEDLRIIPLDSRADAPLISDIWRVCRADGLIFAIDKEKIIRYDDGGNYICTIATRGQGPEEVLDFNDFDVDSGKVIVMDPLKFKFYDYNGNFLKAMDNPYGFGRFRHVSDGGRMVLSVLPMDNGNRIFSLSSSGDTVFSCLGNVEHDHPFRGVAFARLDSTRYLHQIGLRGNEIFLIGSSGEESKAVNVSSFEDAMSGAECNAAARVSKGPYFEVNDLYYCAFTDNKSMLSWQGIKSSRRSLYLYDKNTGATLKLNLHQMKDDIFVPVDEDVDKFEDMMYSFCFCLSDDDYFVMLLNPESKYAIETSNPFYQEMSKLNDVSEDSNPVIALIKFKSPQTVIDESK